MKIKDLLMPTVEEPLQEQDFYNINTLGQPAPQEKKRPGLLKRFGQAAAAGIKQGAGINANAGLTRGIAAKTLRAANMPASATAVDQSASTPGRTIDISPDDPLPSNILQKFAVGNIVDHPKLGKMTVKRANMHGVTFDTKNTFGHDLTMSPGQLKAAFGYK